MIEINKSQWEIIEVEAHNENLFVNGNRCVGSAHYYDRKIYLEKAATNFSKYQTLCHELAHAFLYETQIGKPNKFNEEAVCEFVAIYSKQIIDIADAYISSIT